MNVSHTPCVHAIIVNWNGRSHLEACLSSVLETRWPNFRPVVIDNGSSDGSQALVRDSYPGVELVELRDNLGFTGANNLGMQRAMDAGADYVVLLNNDTRVTPDWLTNLVDVGEQDKTIAACHSRQLTWEGDREIRLSFYPEYAAGDNAVHAITAETAPYRTPYAAGCCMLLRTSTLRQIGLFDSRYFAYAEDLDLCLRAWTAGFQVLYVPASTIYHRIGGTMATKRDYWGYRNQLTTMLKNYEWQTLWAFRDAILPRWFLTSYRTALRASISAMAMLPGTASRRRRIQAQRVRSDAEVFSLMGIQPEGVRRT